MNDDEYRRECDDRVRREVRREGMYGDAVNLTGDIRSHLFKAGGSSDGSEYSKASLRAATAKAERLLSVLRELGG